MAKDKRHLSALAKVFCRQLFSNPRVDIICPTTGSIFHFIPLSEGHYLKRIDMQAGLNAYIAYGYAYVLTTNRDRINIWQIRERGEPGFVGYVGYPGERGIISYESLTDKLELTFAEDEIAEEKEEGTIICLSRGI